jgi:hypothetical protein
MSPHYLITIKYKTTNTCGKLGSYTYDTQFSTLTKFWNKDLNQFKHQT